MKSAVTKSSVFSHQMDIPKVYDSSLPVFTLWFLIIYMLGYFVLFRNWDKKYKSEASSCLMSLSHGSPAFFLSVFSIWKTQNSLLRLDFTSPNTPFQDLVLEYSVAYFLMDLLHYVLVVPSDVLFIAHHLATLYVLTTCRYLFQHGAVAILGILALAEVTTTCQNTWSLARYRKVDSAKAAALLESLSPIFYGYYTLVRGVLGPLFLYKVGLYFSSVDGCMIPRWAGVSWMVVIAVGIGVSMLWVLHLWIDLYKQKSKDKKKLS